ncbi:F0F1 ATP synthase subunit gamma [Aquiluna borgnonia]|uniref:ATP synthase gamma chain n=1 Tax=Aquiluna borgnonia TaxID=2499157 RepID=A0A7D4UB15_9MICO|nr:F0F1 ATP synthase subunit gamma [Aquiluna borgnonia]QKJ25497.1 F0F1 ATP synthase subunit gamma [Aquiluna borgnonia]
MGAQLRVYRQKIKSAKTTKKITRAMELISASRIQKAQQRVAASTPYTRAVTRAVSAVASHANIDHPLTRAVANPVRSAVVIFTSDRGLAGAFSSGVLKEAEALTARLKAQGQEVVYFLVGRKAVGNFNFRRRPFIKDWTGGTDLPQFETATSIANELLALFSKSTEEGGVDEIFLVGNEFVSMMIQEPKTARLLPLEVVEQQAVAEHEVFPLYEFEPEADKVLDALLPVYIENRIYNVMLQSAAAEHAARQKAMKSATDNADKLILNYTRLANAARQAEITQQISEIVGGADALATVNED